MHSSGAFHIRGTSPRRLRRPRAKERGSAIVIAIIAAALLITSGAILASRSLWFLSNTVKGSDFKNAREAAEYGASAITEELNIDGSSYLLVTQPACWQSRTLNIDGIFMPPGINPGPDRVPPGVISNSAGQDWQVVPLKPGETVAAALNSGNYARYQLTDYTPPRKPSSGTKYSFSDTCPTTLSAQFGNRYGGTAYITIRGELYRKSKLESEHTITQEVHVKGALASSNGEPSVVLLSGADLATIKPWLDLNNNDEKDSNEPWLDIFCVYCTGINQEELKTALAPVGVGFQGVMANSYDGTIITGNYIFPSFPFFDSAQMTGSEKVYTDGEDLPIPKDLYDALKAKASTWSPSVQEVLSGTDESEPLSGKQTSSTTIYSSETGAATDAKVTIEFCAKNSNKTPCSKTEAGDIAQITKLSGNLSSTDLADGAFGWVAPNEICNNLGLTGSYCSGSRLKVRINFQQSDPLTNPINLISATDWYPYATNADKTRSSDYRTECAEAYDNDRKTAYIGCVHGYIDIPSGSVTVVTNETLDKPVYIFVQNTDGGGGPVVDFYGNRALLNQRGNDPESLSLLGLPGRTTNPSTEVCDQTIKLYGTSELDGIWAWFPRGIIDTGTGSSSASGLLWVCDFAGKGNFKFMGANQNASAGTCGDMPCGIYKYRAQGIAQIHRE